MDALAEAGPAGTVWRGEQIDGAVLNVLATPALDPDAPWLVLVNSLGCDLRIWTAMVPRLSRHLNLLRYDKRGHGLSDCGEAPVSLDRHADDLLALIGRLPDRAAFVCGLSIGGQIAMAGALNAPDAVRGLILSDTAARIGSAERYRAREAAVHEGGIEAIAEDQIDRWFADPFRAGEQGKTRLMRNMLARQPRDGYLASVAAVRDTDLSAHLGRIVQPTLCLAGAEDRSTPPAQARALCEAIPGAALQVIDGAGHMPCLEQPEAMSRLILDFVQRNA